MPAPQLFVRRASAVSTALALIVVGAGCAPDRSAATNGGVATVSAPQASSVPSGPAGAGSSGSADDAVNQVLAISVDGLNPKAIRELGPKKTPAFHRLLREGAGTMNARTEREQTRTLPNHTGMLTGRRIDAKRGGHGITYNSDRGSTVHKAAGHYVASVFDVVHDHGGSTGLFAAKTKFTMFSRTWNTNGAADKVGKDNGRKKIDRVRIDSNNSDLVSSVIKELKDEPRTFTFLHLSAPDQAGHAKGFMGRDYLKAVEQTDARLGRLLDTIAGDPALKKHLLVVLTADHGGSGAKSHSTQTKLANYRVPFLVWGPGVAKGKNLYTLNPELRSPGSARTSYRGEQPVRNGDLANLATDVLDLPAVKGSEFDNPRRLDVFN